MKDTRDERITQLYEKALAAMKNMLAVRSTYQLNQKYANRYQFGICLDL